MTTISHNLWPQLMQLKIIVKHILSVLDAEEESTEFSADRVPNLSFASGRRNEANCFPEDKENSDPPPYNDT